MGSLASLTKKKLIERSNTYTFHLPNQGLNMRMMTIKSSRTEWIASVLLSILRNSNKWKIKSKPFVANTKELKVSFVTYPKENRPDLLECKVEK
jgi:hypothetical protein